MSYLFGRSGEATYAGGGVRQTDSSAALALLGECSSTSLSESEKACDMVFLWVTLAQVQMCCFQHSRHEQPRSMSSLLLLPATVDLIIQIVQLGADFEVLTLFLQCNNQICI